MTRILLTGASRGIGAAAMTALEKRGAKVVGQATSTGDAGLLAADFRDPDAPEKLWEKALEASGGHIDVLVNNAGTVCRERPGQRSG